MFKFPYTNFSQINLDWILDKIKELEENSANKYKFAGSYILTADFPTLAYSLKKDKIKNDILITMQSRASSTYPATTISIPVSQLYNDGNTVYNASGSYGDTDHNLTYKYRYSSNFITITIYTLIPADGNEYCVVMGNISPLPESGNVEIAVYYK